jgi:hypothetical protein
VPLICQFVFLGVVHPLVKKQTNINADKYVRSSTTEMYKKAEVERGTPESICPLIDEQLANRRILTAKNATELKKLGTLDRKLNENGKTRLRKQN